MHHAFHGEFLKLGIEITEPTVAKYMVRHRKPPSQTWRTFLDNHLRSLVSVDFFTVPMIGFQVLYVFLVLVHDRRRILQFGVTAHPTAEWTAQQLREAFPWDSVPRYRLRDRDQIFGKDFVDQFESVIHRWKKAAVYVPSIQYLGGQLGGLFLLPLSANC